MAFSTDEIDFHRRCQRRSTSRHRKLPRAVPGRTQVPSRRRSAPAGVQIRRDWMVQYRWRALRQRIARPPPPLTRLDSVPWQGPLFRCRRAYLSTHRRVRPRHRRRSGACRPARASGVAAALLPRGMFRRSPGDCSVHASILAVSSGDGFRLDRSACRAGGPPGGAARSVAPAGPAGDPWYPVAPVVGRDGARTAPEQAAPASADHRAASAPTSCRHGAWRRAENGLRAELRRHRTHTHWPTSLTSSL
jgi:hypothetical protein